MRRRDQALRIGLALALLSGSLGFVVPLGLGLWDPAWLRLAGDVELDPTEPKLEPGEVRHPFVVEQSDLRGRLRWRLSGSGLRGPSDAADLLKDQVVIEPRLELFSLGNDPDAPLTQITAERARVQVSEGAEGERRVRLDLGPGLHLQRGGLRLRGEELVAWFDPDQPQSLRLRTEQALRLEFQPEDGQGRWELAATSLEASGERIVLGGPIEVQGGPFRGGPLAGYRVQGRARSAVLTPRATPSPEEPELSGPWSLALTDLQLTGREEGPGPGGSFELAAERASARLVQGPKTGAETPARPAPEALSFEGGVAARLRRAEPALDLQLAGDRLQLGRDRGVVLEGRNARLSDAVGGFSARGERFELQQEPGGELSLRASDLRELELREPAPGAEEERRPARWRGQVGSLQARLSGVGQVGSGSLAQLWSGARGQDRGSAPDGVAQLTSGARGSSVLERLRSLEVREGLALERIPGPDRVRLERLSWSRSGAEDDERALRRLEVQGLAALFSRGAAPEKGDPGVPWGLEAGRLELTTRRSLASLAALATSSQTGSRATGALPWSEPLAALETLSAREGFRLERRGAEEDPRKRLRKARGLSAAQLSYPGPAGQVVATGQVKATLGALSLAAPEMSLDPEGGRIQAREVGLGLVRLVKTRAQGSEPAAWVREEYSAQASEGEARLSLDPAAWSRERERRRGRRRAGAALTVPEPLQALDLRGRVVASGPRGLEAAASRVRLEGRRLRLEGRPARLSEERGQVAARLLRLSWEEADLAPLDSGARVARDATRVFVDAEGEVTASGALGARRFTLAAARAKSEVYEVVGLPAKDPAAPFPLGAFSAAGPEGVTLTWLAEKRDGASREVKLRTTRLSGQGRAQTPSGDPGLRLELEGRWATTLSLPKRGMSQVSGGRADALLDPAALRAGPRKDEQEEAYLRRLLRGLSVREGFRISASGFEARASEASLDPERSTYLLRGDPVVLRRGGLRQTMRQATIRLSEE